MRKIVFIIMSMVFWYSCADDEPGVPEIQGVSFSEFLDVRDSSTYRCVTINGQTWMAENLHYRHPWGSYGGCYSYMEEQLDTTDFYADGTEFYTVLNQALQEGSVVAPDNVFNSRLNLVRVGMWSVVQFCSFCESTYKDSALLEYVNAVRKDLEIKARDGVAVVNLEKAEKDNGGYKDQFGFLYTYEAAKEALPEGWRLPTDEDWKKLEQALGMSEKEADEMESWRGTLVGRLLKKSTDGVGFDVSWGGGRLYGKVGYGSIFRNRNSTAYYWTATEVSTEDAIPVAVIRKFFYHEDRVYRGTAKTYETAYSVRGIKK